jgi:hypothetical protein
MKKKFILAFGLLIMTSLARAQTLYVANNNPGANAGTNVFTGVNAIRDAFTASVAGDIIYVVPSPTTYGSLNITHGITIFGVGIRPSKDLGAKSLIGLVNIDADNVRLSGLINSTGSSDEIRLGWNTATGVNIDGITIENCRISRVLMTSGFTSTVSNLLIRNNVITGNGSLATHVLLNTTANAIITNNIMTEGGSGPMIRALNATITYNVFAHTGNENSFDAVNDCIFDHNIFYGVRVDIPIGSTGNSWTNNLSYGNTTDSFNVFNVTDNGNNDVAAPGSNIESVGGSNDPLFVNFPLTSAWNDSYDLALQGGSPALNVNGEDIGPSGGATPFDFEGNILPLIQSVTVPSVIPLGTDLPVTIKAKGN